MRATVKEFKDLCIKNGHKVINVKKYTDELYTCFVKSKVAGDFKCWVYPSDDFYLVMIDDETKLFSVRREL